jgi:hypothetical protein
VSPPTTDVCGPILDERVESGTLRLRDFQFAESTVHDDISDEFMSRIQNGLAEMERGEGLTFEEVFGRPF